MFRTLSVVVGALLLIPNASSQRPADAGAPTRQSGAIFKREIDDLLALLRSTARRGIASPAATAVLGSDVLTTAKMLTAMGHCSRRYHFSDGPVVRPSLDYLLASRKADGSFGDAQATAWVLDALSIMNGEGYRAEIRNGRKWLEGSAPAAASFQDAVQAKLAAVRVDHFPEQMGAMAAGQMRGMQRAPNNLDRAAAADVLVTLVACQAANVALDQADRREAKANTWSAAQQRSFDWLFQQQEDGVFSVSFPVPNEQGEEVMRSFPDPALTGFGLMALQGKPMAKRTNKEQETIAAGLAWLLKQQNEDGTFGTQVLNYTTSVVVGALSRANDPLHAPVMAKAQKALLLFQNIEAGGYDSSDRDYGSIGYGGSQRGDLSNTHFSMEALRATGLPEDHEAMQKALVFLQRTQNLKSSNDFKGKVPHPNKQGAEIEIQSGDDGGAAYYPGNSAAGYVVQPDGTAIARSYGSMTYALLKSYTLAGVKGDDPRVQAAVKWIQNNWTLAVNPGADPALGEKVKYQGLFYYYMVLAQALDAAGIEAFSIPDPAVVGDAPAMLEINWRDALRARLVGMQQEDGSWVNGKNGRWMESMPLLCTCYAMIALEQCR
jgi:hypothetical protein